MVLQGSPFAYAEEILAAMEQEDAVTPAVVEEPAAEGPVAEDATEESVAEDATEEAAPAEAEAVAIEGQGEADAESEPAEAVAAKTEYVYEDDTLKVTAKLDDAAAIPDDAQLMVTAITAESDKYNYDAYMTALNEGGQPKANGQNTMLYDVAFLVYAEDGTATEVQPTVGSVHVTFDFKKAQLESIGVEDSEQVSVTHLPLVDSAKADTTAQATNITPNDVIVEDVETAQVNVDADTIELQAKQFSVFAVGYTVDFTYDNYTFSIEGKSEILLSVLFTELGIDADVTKVTDVSFSDPELVTVSKQDGDWLLASKKAFKTTERLTVTMLSGATYEIVVTDAQDRTAKVQLFDDDACEIPATDTGLASDNAFCIVATLLDKDEKVLGYNYDWVNASDLQNHEWVFSDGDFKGLDESGNPTGGTVAYDEAAKHTIRLRMYRDYIWHWQTNYLDLIGLPDTVNGYIFKDALVDGTTTTLRLRKGFPAEYQVKVTIDPSVTSADLEGLKLYAEAQHQSTGKDWYEGALPAADTVLVLYDPARDPKSQWTQNPGGDFSGNETTRAYVKDASGNRIPSGSYINGLVINYPKKTAVEDEAAHETLYTDYVHITRIDKFEPAIDPYDVLGEGAEYGVVADTFIRHDHTETNFAVNHYDESQTASGIDLAANGGESEAMPFYVGDYSRIHFTGNTTVDPDIYAPSKRDSSYIHTAEDEAEDRIHQDAYTYDVTVIPTSVSDVKSYVDGLIEKLSSSSSTYKDKPSITAEPGKVLDTTQLPDNVTIYVDASNLNTNETGWEIKKLEGQSIVLNIPGKNVTINKEVVHVYSKDDGGNLHLIKTVDANTNGNGGDKAHNKDVEDHILNHIVFNAYEAESVEFVSGPAGLFLAPNATFKENSGSGTGWVATGQTFIQHSSEWHFFRTQRKYKAKGDFSLSGQKKIVEDGTEKEYSEFSSMTFTFDLYSCNENGTIADDAEPLETVTADSNGGFAFSKLKYTQVEVPKGETRTFFYVVKEQDHEPEHGVTYDAPDVLVRVVASDADGDGTITFEISTNRGEGWSDPITPTGDEDNKVYDIGGFANTYKEETTSAQAKKDWDGGENKRPDSLSVTLEAIYKAGTANEHAEDIETVTLTAPQWESKVIDNLPVKDDDGDPIVYHWVENNVPEGFFLTKSVETIGENNCVITTLTNTYQEFSLTTSYVGTKTWNVENVEYIPAHLTVELYQDGMKMNPQPQISWEKDGKNWTYTFENLPVFKADGSDVHTYYAKETPVTGFAYEEHNIPTEYERGEATQSGDMIMTCAKTDITIKLNSATDLAWSVIKLTQGKGFLIWTHRVPSESEYKSILKEAKDNMYSEFDGKQKYRISGVDCSFDTNAGTITVDYNKDAKEVNIHFPHSNAWASLGYGNFGEDVKYDPGTTSFINTKIEGTATLKAAKALGEGDLWPEGGQVSFTIAKQAGSDAAPLPDPATTEALTQPGEKSFSAVTFDSDDVDKTYFYEITESTTGFNDAWQGSPDKIIAKVEVGQVDQSGVLHPVVSYSSDGGKTYGAEASSYTFTNSYAASGQLVLSGTKVIESKPESMDLSGFKFTVKEGGETVATGESDAQGKITFDAIAYPSVESVGEHTYEVTEDASPTKPGVTNSTSTVTVKVNVSDNGEGGLVATATEDSPAGIDAVNFTNSYEAKGSITLEGTKTIDTREIAEGETFSFEIRDNKGTVVSKGKSDGKRITFEPIEYVKNKDKDQTGTFTYSVVETSADGKGITTDKKSHKAVVKVTDNGKGELVVELVEDKSDINFVNKYDAAGSFQIAGLTKVLKNGELKAKQFSFQLKDADGKVLQTAYNDDSGNITFSAISYTLADLKGAASKKFSYTVNEVVPAGATKNADGTYTAGGITYSGDVVSFEVTVSDNGDGTLKIEGAEGGKVDLKHVFVNSQQEKKQAEKKKLAKTSDLANPGLMAGIAGAGLAIVVIGLINRRRRRDQ